MDIGNQRIGLVILSLMKMDGYFMKCWSGFMFLQMTWKDFGFGRRSLAGFGRKRCLPFLWSNKSANWLYLINDSQGTKLYYNYSTKSWIFDEDFQEEDIYIHPIE